MYVRLDNSNNSNNSNEEEEENVEKRMFLEDGDTVVLRGWCGQVGDGEGESEGEGEGESGLVGFGECVGRIEPAVKLDL